jgi:hypothetical protein
MFKNVKKQLFYFLGIYMAISKFKIQKKAFVLQADHGKTGSYIFNDYTRMPQTIF